VGKLFKVLQKTTLEKLLQNCPQLAQQVARLLYHSILAIRLTALYCPESTTWQKSETWATTDTTEQLCANSFWCKQLDRDI